jgi:hypothetical protein
LPREANAAFPLGGFTVPDATSDPGPPSGNLVETGEWPREFYIPPGTPISAVTLKPPDPKRGFGTRAEFTCTRDNADSDSLGETSPGMPDDNDGPEPIIVSAKA